MAAKRVDYSQAGIRSRVAVESDGCWRWLGYVNKRGYGYCGSLLAHRASYTAFVGQIKEGMTIDHLCRNRACVNPEHLEQVTMQINNARGFSPSALQTLRTECPKGHPLSGDNLYLYKNKRGCKECRREGNRRFLRERPAYSCAHSRKARSAKSAGQNMAHG